MDSQTTPSEVTNSEKRVVAMLLGLNGTTDITFDDSGWDSRAYIIDGGRYVFKFARTNETKTQYQKEIAALILAAKTAAQIKLPIVRWQDVEVGYYGYEGIVGNQLKTISADAELLEMIGDKLGSFLKNFHQQSLDLAPRIGLAEEYEEFLDKYQTAQPVLNAYLTPKECNAIDNIMLISRKELETLGQDAVLSHGDLAANNIVITAKKEVGLIDFGEVSYLDRARDFAALNSKSLTACLSSYGADSVLRKKVAIRRRVHPIIALPFYIGKNDTAGIKHTIEQIRKETLLYRR